MTPPPVRAPGDSFVGAPIDQSPDALKRSFFPPRPNKEESPEYYAAWEAIARQPLRCIIPLIVEEGPLAETRNWAGAVLPVRQREGYNNFCIPAQGPFDGVMGSWIVPNPYPQLEADGKTYRDGEYRFYSWTGLDGWQNEVCLKIGIVSTLSVRGGVIVSRGHYPAILIRGRNDDSIRVVVLKGLPIESGDYVTGNVWSELTPNGQVGYGCIVNHGTGQWSSATVEGKDIFIEGLSAEWIGATENPTAKSHPAPDFGAMFFANGVAMHRIFREGRILSGGMFLEESGMSRALLANAQDTKSAAKRPHTVVVYGQGWCPPPVIY
jgi:hypothetical protein